MGMKPIDFRVFLKDELARRCQKNPAYSLRAFARTLGTDPGTLSKILAHKRAVGPITIERYGKRLDLGPSEIARYLNLPQKKTVSNSQSTLRDLNYQQLSIDRFCVIGEWQHFAILELMRLDEFQPKAGWIASRLGVSVHEVNSSIDRLQRLELLKISPNGKWIDTSDGATTTLSKSEFTDTALKKLQRQFLAQAIEALELYGIESRDQSTLTMAIDTSKINQAKAEIKKFRRRMGKLLSRGKTRNEVYNLTIALYPLTKSRTTKGIKS